MPQTCLEPFAFEGLKQGLTESSFPKSNADTTRAKRHLSRMIVSVLFDFTSFSISTSWASVETIFQASCATCLCLPVQFRCESFTNMVFIDRVILDVEETTVVLSYSF